MKSARQNTILEIIASKDIETQNQLMQALSERGVKSTQATLSRDIKELRLVKELSPNGRYRYAQPAHDETAGHNEKLRKIFREGVISCDTAMNLRAQDPAGPGLGGQLRDGRHGPALAGGYRRGRRHGVHRHARHKERGALLRGDKKAVLRGKEAESQC